MMNSGENKFVFVTPMFNASKTLSQMLHSLYGQSYQNWHLILIDDASDEAEVLKCKELLQKFDSFIPNKQTVIWNDSKKWEVLNVLTGVSMCVNDDIVCRIDGDDWLTDLDALAIIDACYTKMNCDALWTMHRWGFSDRNISMKLSSNTDVYAHPWVSSHFKTFRKRLLNNVPYENFKNMNDQLVRRAGDQAIYLPVLHNATNKMFLPRVMYHYTIDEQDGAVYQTDDAKFQKEEAEFIRSRGYVTQGVPWELCIN